MKTNWILIAASVVLVSGAANVASAATAGFVEPTYGTCIGNTTPPGGDEKTIVGSEVGSAADVYCVQGNPDYSTGSINLFGMDYTLGQKLDQFAVDDDDRPAGEPDIAFGEGLFETAGDGEAVFTSFTAGDDDEFGTWHVDFGINEISSMVFGIKQGSLYAGFMIEVGGLSEISGTWATWDDILADLMAEDRDLSIDLPNASFAISHIDVWYKTCTDNDPLCDEDDSGLDPVPLPAGLPLVLTGLGVMGILRARKRKAA